MNNLEKFATEVVKSVTLLKERLKELEERVESLESNNIINSINKNKQKESS
tara:strand:+ start:818 stop:970 length:153 start_codon:yes stop_codon:yes gene_type:complete